MNPHSPLTVVFDYAYTLLATPWLLIHFYWDLLLCLPPWTRPGKAWTINQAARMRVVKLVLHYWSLTRSGDRLHLRPGSEGNRWEAITPAPAKFYQGALSDPEVKPAPMGLTWTPARPPPPALIKPELTLCLHFHGGGFAIGAGRDADAGYQSRTLMKHMGATHVCQAQYRLSSSKNGRFPAPVQDALTSYLYITRDRGIPASQVIVSGDSAGANIALGLLRYIHEHGAELNIPAPRAVALWSPWVHVGAAIKQDMRMSPNYRTDYLNKEFGRWGAVAVAGSGAGAVDPEGPYLSPLHHPFKLEGEVPMFVHAGNAEVLYDDIQAFAEIYGKLGWEVHLDVTDDAPHDIVLLGPQIGFGKQAEAAAREAGKFFARTTKLNLRLQPGV